MLAPYPVDVSDAVNVVLKKIRGEVVALPEAVHAGWHVVGFALGKVLPDGVPMVMGEVMEMTANVTLTPEQIADYLTSVEPEPGAVKGLLIPWKAIAANLLRLLAEWIAAG